MPRKTKKKRTYKFDLIGNSLTTFEDFPFEILLLSYRSKASPGELLEVLREYSRFPLPCHDQVVTQFPKGSLPHLFMLAESRGVGIELDPGDQP